MPRDEGTEVRHSEGEEVPKVAYVSPRKCRVGSYHGSPNTYPHHLIRRPLLNGSVQDRATQAGVIFREQGMAGSASATNSRQSRTSARVLAVAQRAHEPEVHESSSQLAIFEISS